MSLFFIPSAHRAIDANGNPYAGAKWYFYDTGTLDPAPIYTTSALAIEHPNPVVADAGGLFENIFLDPDTIYRAVLKNSSGSITVKDIDPYNAAVTGDLDYLIHVQFLGTPDVQQIVAGNIIPEGYTVTLPADLDGVGFFRVTTAPAAELVLTMENDGASFGTVTISTAGAIAISSSVSVFTGDALFTITSPADATTVVNIFGTIVGVIG